MDIVENKEIKIDFDKVQSMIFVIEKIHSQISSLNVEERKLFEKKFYEFLYFHGWIQG